MNLNTYKARDALLRVLGYPSYRHYLKSPKWYLVRTLCKAALGTRCRICGKRTTTYHHIVYTAAVLLGTSLQGLVPLCKVHHRRVEFWTNGRKRTLRESQVAYVKMLRRRLRKKKSP